MAMANEQEVDAKTAAGYYRKMSETRKYEKNTKKKIEKYEKIMVKRIALR